MNHNYKINDFISADLTVSQIITVDYITTANWSRPNPFPRPSNGLVLLTEGSIKYYFENETVTAHAGDVLKFPKGLVYSGVKLRNEINSFYVVDFYTAYENEYDNFPLPFVYHANNYNIIEKQFNSLLNLWRNPNIASKMQCKSRLYRLFSEILHDYAGLENQKDDISKISRVIEFINYNYSNPSLSIPMLCQKFYLSESTIRRIFQSTCKMSPLEYITQVRVNAAKNMLTYDNAKISDIAAKCGFASLYYFSRVFKKATGQSPSRFRRH